MEYRVKIVNADGTEHVIDKSFATEEAAWSYVLNESGWSDNKEKMQEIYKDAEAVVFQVGEDGKTPIKVNNYVSIEEGEIRRINSGKSIQFIALVVLIFGCAYSLFNGYIISMYLSSNYRGDESLVTIASVGSVVIGLLVSFILHYLIIGFGELVQYTAESTEYLDYLSRKEGYRRTR